MLLDLEFTMTAYTAHRIRKFQVPAQLIEEIDTKPCIAPICPRGKLRLHVTTNKPGQTGVGRGTPLSKLAPAVGVTSRPGSNSVPASAGGVAAPQQPRLGAPAPLLSSSAAAAATSGALTRSPIQVVVQQSGTVHALTVPVAPALSTLQDTPRDGVTEKLGLTGEGRISVAQQILNVAANETDAVANTG